MMRPMMLAAAAGFSLTIGSAGAMAQTMSYAQAGALIARSCGPSIEKFCPKANLGTGDIASCLQEKGAQVPAQCFSDLNAAVASINRRVAAQNGAYRTCRADVAEFCQGVQPGDGNIRDCLVASKMVVRGACKQVLVDAGWY